MKKLSIYLFAATTLCSHIYCMEEKNIIEKEENQEYDIISPFKEANPEYIENHWMLFNPTNEKVELFSGNRENPLLSIHTYNLDDEKIKEYTNTDVIPFGNRGNKFIFLLDKGIQKKDDSTEFFSDDISNEIIKKFCEDYSYVISSKEEKPFLIYNKETDDIDQLHYKLQESDDLRLLSGSINTENYEWKVVSFNTNSKNGKIIIFNKNNDVVTVFDDKSIIVSNKISHSGNYLLTAIARREPFGFAHNLYNITNKEKPELINVIATNLNCSWNLKKDIFCDEKNIRDEKGNILKTITNSLQEQVVAFSEKYYVLTDTKNNKAFLGTIDGSQKQRELKISMKALNLYATLSKENIVAIYDPSREDYKKVSFYKYPQNTVTELPKKSSYFSNCIIN